jgi:sec-independent protein translocase protein TatA
MGGFSLWHILIFAIIVLLLFGGNRFSNMMGDVAKGLKSFKQGLAEDDKQPEQKQIPPQQPIDVTPRPAEPAATATPNPPGDDQTRS